MTRIVVDDATPTPNTVGFRWDASVSGSANFAMEVWSGIPGQACDAEGFPLYGYWLYPFVVSAQIQEYVVENGALTLGFTARTSAGSGWGVGAFDVRRDAIDPFAPEPLLTAIGAYAARALRGLERTASDPGLWCDCATRPRSLELLTPAAQETGLRGPAKKGEPWHCSCTPLATGSRTGTCRPTVRRTSSHASPTSMRLCSRIRLGRSPSPTRCPRTVAGC